MAMLATDFEYDGVKLSDFGFTLCEFDSSSGMEEVSVGSVITFNTVSRHSGKIYGLPSTRYDETIEVTFSACKSPCDYSAIEVTSEELHDITRWLNRREFLKMQFLYDDDDMTGRQNVYYNASFNIAKVSLNGVIYGFTATMITNSPFGYGDEITETISVTSTSSSFTIEDQSGEIGVIYPTIKIVCNESGDLELTNSTEECQLVINNCVAGETITIDGDTLIISTSESGHALYDDFNFDFFRISNTYSNRNNVITCSLRSTITITYTPIYKDSPD